MVPTPLLALLDSATLRPPCHARFPRYAHEERVTAVHFWTVLLTTIVLRSNTDVLEFY